MATSVSDDVPLPSTSSDTMSEEKKKEITIQAINLLAQGKRNLLCQEIPTAVDQLQEASKLLASTFGETSKECAEVYLTYGRALLELARLENGVLGNALQGVPSEEEGELSADDQFEKTDDIKDEERLELRISVCDALSKIDEETFAAKDATKEGLNAAGDGHKIAEDSTDGGNIGKPLDSGEAKPVTNVDKPVENDVAEQKKSEDKVVENCEAKTVKNGEVKTVENGEAKAVENGNAKAVENGEAKVVETGEVKVVENDVAKAVENSEVKVVENSKAKVIENGKAKVIENGKAKTDENCEAEAMENGEAKAVENGNDMECEVKGTEEGKKVEVESGDKGGEVSTSAGNVENKTLPDEKAEEGKIDDTGKSDVKEKVGKTDEKAEEKMDESDKKKEISNGTSEKPDESGEKVETGETNENDASKEVKKDDQKKSEEDMETESAEKSEENSQNDTGAVKTDDAKPDAKTMSEADDDKKKEEDANDEENEDEEGEESMDNDEEDVGEEEEEEGCTTENPDDVSNFQLAWEVLELAKIIYIKETEDKMKLKASEACMMLGEISLETEQYEKAIDDMTQCLTIQTNHLEPENRLIAETHYQLGLAYLFNAQHHDALKNLEIAISVIKTKIEKLKKVEETGDTADMESPTEKARREITELEGILPEILAKVEDVKEEMKNVDAVKAMAKEAFSNAVESVPAFQSSDKPENTTEGKVHNIGHLIRKKRKPEEDETTSEDNEAKKSRPDVSRAKVGETEKAGDKEATVAGHKSIPNGVENGGCVVENGETKGDKPVQNGVGKEHTANGQVTTDDAAVDTGGKMEITVKTVEDVKAATEKAEEMETDAEPQST